MKRAFSYILAAVVLAIVALAVILWLRREPLAEPKRAADKSAEETGPKHDENGQVILHLSREVQATAGLKLAKPAPAQAAPEKEGFGSVLDPAALAALAAEWAAAEASYLASSNEFVRLQTLAGQSNASERALQTGRAAAIRDQLAVQAARDRLLLGWGKAVADQKDLSGFVQSLTSQRAALVRVDLPAGDALALDPQSARISTLSGKTTQAEFLGRASNVDTQTLSRGFLFLVQTNAPGLAPGEAVSGYLKLPGRPVAGAVIPAEAIVRAEGATWVYINKDESFVRTRVHLDHPMDGGWFVSTGITTNDSMVVTGAQTLLSEELKASLKPD